MKKRKHISWPRGICGKGQFEFTERQRKEISEILSPDHVTGVEIESVVYILSTQYQDIRSMGEKDKALAKILDHVCALLDLLTDQLNADHLLNRAGELFGDYVSLQIAKSPHSSHGTKLQINEQLQLIKMVCTVVKARTPKGPGRRPGTENKAAHKLLNQLYYRCVMVNGEHLTTARGNMLERLVEVLREPLALGGNLPGIVRSTIEFHSKKA